MRTVEFVVREDAADSCVAGKVNPGVLAGEAAHRLLTGAALHTRVEFSKLEPQ